MFSSISNVLLLAFGFGFVIFFHELGHFLAAKWAGVKVEQFAVGFGQALLSWRKGLGVRWGSSQEEFRQRLMEYCREHQIFTPEPSALQLDRAATALGLAETEYRLNWIPLGGYVKMLGQDDLKPGSVADDPRAFNNKSIGRRMVIVSAGVIMNVILAAIGFMIIFRVGFKVPPAIVGTVLPGSPAQAAWKIVDGKTVAVGLSPGDRILYLNDRSQSDFEKLKLNTLLLQEGVSVPIYVQHPDGTTDHLNITPTRPTEDADFVLLGITPSRALKGLAVDDKLDDEDLDDPQLAFGDLRILRRGDVITAVAGQSVTPDQGWKLDDALQAARGQPVQITVLDTSGKTRQCLVPAHFAERFFFEHPFNFAGLLPRLQVRGLDAKSPVRGILLPDDIIVAFSDPKSSDPPPLPTADEFQKMQNKVGLRGDGMNVTVLRQGKTIELNNLKPSTRLSPTEYSLDVMVGIDEQNPVVAGVLENSPSALVPAGARIVSIDGQAVHSWFDVNYILADLRPQQPATLIAQVGGHEKTFALGKISSDDIASARQNRLVDSLSLQPAITTRKTGNLLVAAQWGIGETRDAILQVYQTVHAMLARNISVKEVSGPVGILTAGYRIAQMGLVRLIWYLSIISANLAVLNFLPIPIVDGGLFTFLIIEKVKGGPLSPRVQTVAQVVGLAILLSVFLFATYQDIFYRLPFLTH